MWIAYVDDAVPTSATAVPPVLAFGAVALKAESLPQLTRDFLALKRRHFAGRFKSRHLLDDVLTEVKGADLKAMIRESHKKRRIAFRFGDDLLALLEASGARIFGRVWIKPIGVPVDGRAVNTFSIQSLCATFQHLLEASNEEGVMIIDSSTPGANAMVSHSIFTQRFRAAGDQYSRLVEMPTFGHSKNHVGLQIADLIASGFVTPIAGVTYCSEHMRGVHIHQRYVEVKARYARRLGALQHRYQLESGAWSGGLTVSDPLRGWHGGHLFHPSCAGCNE